MVRAREVLVPPILAISSLGQNTSAYPAGEPSRLIHVHAAAEENDRTRPRYHPMRYHSPALYGLILKDVLGAAGFIGSSGQEPEQSCEVSPRSLNNYLYGTPLFGLGGSLLQAGAAYGVDPRLVAAIAGAETGFGRNIRLGPYNAWNWHNPRNPLFSNREDAISAVTRGIGLGPLYFRAGRTDTAALYARYCTGPDCVNGLKSLNQFLRQQGGDPKALGFPCD
jgi:hypothetical protein